VKKNAIMMIDSRWTWSAPKTSALKKRLQSMRDPFSSVMMTTMAALLGALPLAIGLGTGSELRRPLGIAVVVD